jgi:hypothetical protein
MVADFKTDSNSSIYWSSLKYPFYTNLVPNSMCLRLTAWATSFSKDKAMFYV